MEFYLWFLHLMVISKIKDGVTATMCGECTCQGVVMRCVDTSIQDLKPTSLEHRYRVQALLLTRTKLKNLSDLVSFTSLKILKLTANYFLDCASLSAVPRSVRVLHDLDCTVTTESNNNFDLPSEIIISENKTSQRDNTITEDMNDIIIASSTDQSIHQTSSEGELSSPTPPSVNVSIHVDPVDVSVGTTIETSSEGVHSSLRSIIETSSEGVHSRKSCPRTNCSRLSTTVAADAVCGTMMISKRTRRPCQLQNNK